jgi:hypothetical protein
MYYVLLCYALQSILGVNTFKCGSYYSGLVSDKSSVYDCSNSDNSFLCGKNWQCYVYSIASGCVTLGHVTPMFFLFQVNLFHSKHIYLALAHAHDVFFFLI